MTALSEYQRLESTGLWRAAPDGQRREVLVVFGDATLVISDTRTMAALAHWSLPAVVRLNPGKRPALYAPGTDGGEELEIDDDTMIAAIGKVRRLIEARRPHPGRLRHVLLGAFVATMLALLLFWLPGALVAHTAKILPDSKREDIGSRVLADLGRLTGSPCSTPEGDAALARLAARVLTAGRGTILVLPTGLDAPRALPGGRIVLPRSFAESDAAPEVLAGHILAARLRAEQADPTRELLDWAGLGTALRLLTTGDLSDGAVHGYAETFLTEPITPVRSEDLVGAFDQARIPSTPFAYALDPSGEATLALIEADPFRSGSPAEPVLSDGDWVALQGICSG
ncbi:hypothetical protein OEW28_06460 [Defluviimonas sp. WL0002]|uniref:Uncharacterized protein n=1 Tax=Albidovulum marisflavi TaxID=2984159 RepID=A0ABT2ZAW1_9RHOB|nr:hypothetical protein [Defluviimonas sp. WL0002]MCV2868268.1 hypothetical protein [Defluviimonas sp. WL0002]